VASFVMEGRPEPRITFSDRMDNGMVFRFDDGKTAYRSNVLLDDVLPQAQMIFRLRRYRPMPQRE
jgi:hypothetical protein